MNSNRLEDPTVNKTRDQAVNCLVPVCQPVNRSTGQPVNRFVNSTGEQMFNSPLDKSVNCPGDQNANKGPDYQQSRKQPVNISGQHCQ